MKPSRSASLSAAFVVAGCIYTQAEAQAPTPTPTPTPPPAVDVQKELAAQNARIAGLEKKIDDPKFKFPEELNFFLLIDTTFVATTNATADGRTKIDMAVPYMSGSRFRIFGKIKTNILDLNVLYKLETEYVTNTGEMDTPNVIFNRDAWVGFSHKDLGQIAFGRQNTLARDFAVIYGDPFAHPEVNYDEGGWTNTNNFKQLIYFAATVDGTRMNRGIVWKRTPAEGLVLGAAYNLTSTETDTSTRNSTACLAAGWNAPTYHVASFYSQANNHGFTQWSFGIGGNVEPTPWLRLNAGFFRYHADQGDLNPTRTDSAFTVSAGLYPSEKWSYFLGLQSMKANDAGLTAAGFMQNPFSNGAASTLFGTGRKDTGYGAIWRRLSKRMEAYLVLDYMKLHDEYRLSGTHGYDNQLEVGLGLRIRAL
jgi:predicted porin